jgi:hypothetical protein
VVGRNMEIVLTELDMNGIGGNMVGWIGLAKDRNRWRALVNSVLNLWVP